MCGIAGIHGWPEATDAERLATVQRMTRTLTHRGPDDEGFHVDGGAALGHRRLSIIDLSTGKQPLSNEDGSVWVVFNGEIYNFKDLTHELDRKGHQFKTRSDTETIVHAYEEWGTGCLTHLRGMFAFALWDSRQRRLFLARDRLGKKPLYYASCGNAFIFGSEIKALLEFPGLDRTFDLEAVSDYLSLMYIPAPKTIFRQVRKLPPGHYLLADAGQVQTRRYWDLSFATTTTDGNPVEHLAAVLRDCVAIRMHSDVPLGAFLSGGVDSSAVVGMMAEPPGSRVVTTSIGFPDDSFNELDYARRVSQHFQTEHHEHVVTPDSVEILQTLIWHYDEPFGDSSALPTYYVSKLARSHFTVALSGDGGDESFAGYRRYSFDVRENKVRNFVPAALRKSVFRLIGSLYPKADYLPQIFRGKAFISNVARTPWAAYLHSVSIVDQEDKRRLLTPDVREALGDYDTVTLFEQLYHAADGPDSLSRIQYIDFKTYLPGDILTKVDRASMANSLEVRCPLLDHKLVEYVASLPSHLKLDGSKTKLIFKEAVRGLLPAEILNRRKMGFAVPLARWLRTDLQHLVSEYVLDTKSGHDLFDRNLVRRWWNEHRSGMRDRRPQLWGLLVFNMWHERFMRR